MAAQPSLKEDPGAALGTLGLNGLELDVLGVGVGHHHYPLLAAVRGPEIPEEVDVDAHIRRGADWKGLQLCRWLLFRPRGLTDVTGCHKPFDICLEAWPPVFLHHPVGSPVDTTVARANIAVS